MASSSPRPTMVFPPTVHGSSRPRPASPKGREVLSRTGWSVGSVRPLLWVLAAPLLGSCLLTPPPDLEEAQEERPSINQALLDPPFWQLLQVQNGESVPITVPFTIVETDSPPVIQLWKNYELPGEQYLHEVTVGPGSGNDDENDGEGSGQNGAERTKSFTWRVGESGPLPAGCAQFTLILTYRNNIQGDSPRKPVDASKTSFVTWWGNVDPSMDDPLTLSNCPSEAGQTAF